MTDKDTKIFESWREASQKFDYFVTGLIGALVAFIGQSFKPMPIGINPGTLELISLLILLFSFWAAFKRIERNTENLRLTFERDREEDQLIEIRTAKQLGQTVNDMQTGQPMSIEAIENLIKSYETKYDHAHELLKAFSKKAYHYYHWRNYLLISGFLLLLVSRVLKSYTCAP